MTALKSTLKNLIPTNFYARVEPTIHLVEAMAMNVRYGFPGRKVRAIGVTGTNGKTTTTLMIQKMLHESGVKAGVLSTVAYGFGGDIVPQKEHVTTGRAGFLQRNIKEFAAQGAEWVVVETSSHGLAQHRVWGIPYEIGVFTNLTQDHLDYHKTFEAYREAKRRLFKIVARHGLKLGIVNAEDRSAQAFIDTVPNAVTYGTKLGDLVARDILLASDKVSYRVSVEGETYNITVNIPGEFNVYNSLAAVAVGRAIGLSRKQIEQGIAALKSVEGRMNLIDQGQKFKVVVDFASSPDAFEKVFESLRPTVKGKLIVVFGSAGRRDEAKRAQQGAIAAKYGDMLVLTEEDDRDEDGAKILAQIAEGARSEKRLKEDQIVLLGNREEAIGFALAQAKSRDDMVLILGKGHEKTIERADGEHPWSDVEVTTAALEALKQS